MFHPWGILNALAHIRLSWVSMPDGVPGRTNGRDIIWLDRRHSQVERRCALTHELIHIEHGHCGCQPYAVEAKVRAEAARRLVKLDHLAKALSWSSRDSFEELADELWVTPEVLRDRFANLTKDELLILFNVELQQL